MFHARTTANGQLTDGGPSSTPELPSPVAGPPFGGATWFGIYILPPFSMLMYIFVVWGGTGPGV